MATHARAPAAADGRRTPPTSSASSCWPPRRAATSTRPLRLQPAARAGAGRCCARRCRTLRRGPPLSLPTSRPRRGSSAQGAVAEAVGAGAPAPHRPGRPHDRRWLDGPPRRRRRSLVSLPHTGTDIPDSIERRLVSPWLGAQGRRLAHRPALRFRRASSAPPSSAPASRARSSTSTAIPSGASLYPGQATTELCPTTTFDGEPLYRLGEAARRRPRSSSAAAPPISTPTTRPRGRDRAPARRAPARGPLRLPLDPLASSRACSTASCRSSTSAPTRARSCDPAPARDASCAICAGSGFSHVANGRFKGGWITRHYGRPGGRRPRGPDGARPAAATCDEDRPGLGPARTAPLQRCCAMLSAVAGRGRAAR